MFPFRMNRTVKMDTSQPGEKVSQQAGSSKADNGTHKVKDGAVKLWVIGDSHLREGHHFPDMYAMARAEGKTDKRFGPLDRKAVWEDEEQGYAQGFYLDEEYKGQVLDLIEESRGQATAILISIGTNDIGKAKSAVTAHTVVRRLKAIMKKAQETPGVVLYVLEPIPREGVAEWLRNRLDRELAGECREYGKTRYVHLTHGDDAALPKTYQEELWEDDKHLNQEGAKKLVEAFIRTQGQTKSDFFLVDPNARESRKNPRRKPEEKKGKANIQQERVGATGNRVLRGGRIGKKRSWVDTGRGKSSDRPVKSRLGYHTGRRGGMSSQGFSEKKQATRYYQGKREEALRLYEERLAEIDRWEREGEPLNEDQGYGGPTPYCQPYRERPWRPEDRHDRGGGFGFYGGPGAGYPTPFYAYGQPWGPNPYTQ
jgi:hypothetical protein